MLKFRFVVFHVAFLLATIWVSPTVSAVVSVLYLYWTRMFGVTAGYHRYFSHRSFKTSRFLRLYWLYRSKFCSKRRDLVGEQSSSSSPFFR